MSLRVAGGLIGAAAWVAVAAPVAALARRAGRHDGLKTQVALHRWLCAVLRVRWRRYGAPGAGPRLIVANHVSWLDILVLGAIEPMTFLAKHEVGANRWTRWLVDLQGAIYVERLRKRCIPRVNAEMARQLMLGAPVALFAEATTSDGTRLLPFRASHFEAARQARAFVQPVYLDYIAVAGLRATRADRSRLAWYGDAAFLPSLRAVLACGGLRCDVHYGEPIPCDGAPDRKALARQVEAAMRAMKQAARRGVAPGIQRAEE